MGTGLQCCVGCPKVSNAEAGCCAQLCCSSLPPPWLPPPCADFTRTKKDVFWVTISQLLEWMRNPVPASQLRLTKGMCEPRDAAPAPQLPQDGANVTLSFAGTPGSLGLWCCLLQGLFNGLPCSHAGIGRSTGLNPHPPPSRMSPRL